MKIEIECGGWWRKMAGGSGMRRKLPQKISNGPRSESVQSQIPLSREETQLLNLKLNGGISVLPSDYGSILRSPSERRRYETRDYRPVTWGICTRRAGKLYKAQSRLYRSHILQVNTRWNQDLFEKKIEKSSRRDLHNALLCTVLLSQNFR